MTTHRRTVPFLFPVHQASAFMYCLGIVSLAFSYQLWQGFPTQDEYRIISRAHQAC
ncbi:hypothetical protein BDV34DRAFT_192796 [Aspergillus parasiticus]|uniref:Uncharacterized protein n=1 Tax=Aspergillus parasiticus TaxID=5067 RepID=A0A5N6DQC8_ASPPA|nr:hypothetical protein BDV34DRAFT_192796 [Aspergillus parasiticus]